MKDTCTHEFGRMHMMVDTEKKTIPVLLIENINRESGHWLTLTSLLKPYSAIGYLRMEPVSLGSTIFQIVEVRPGDGPLLRLPDASPAPAVPPQEGSE